MVPRINSAISSLFYQGYRNMSFPLVQARFHPIHLNRIHHHHHHHRHYYQQYTLKNNTKKRNFAILRRPHGRCVSSIKANADDCGASVEDNFHADSNGSTEKDESRHKASFSSKVILEKLKRYGVSGVLAYGLLNTAYYLTTFLLVWFYVVPAPGKMGYLAAVERFLKLMAMVWAGSQVTKLVRAGGALALAPFVDKGLSWFTVKFKFASKGKAFMAIVGLCFGLAAVLFLTITLLWA